MGDDNSAAIARLNDAARTTLSDCRVVMTQGVADLGNVGEVFEKVCSYTDFNERNDPYGEHDFGSFEFAGQLVFWKFDYFDVDLLMHSPDASDPAVTCRVLTVMLAEEY
ncbi:hypothetical protein IP81_06510 [Novosphingobium sp. AAP83]|uniref:DUF3768 domain-containing protein n=1 Tax=Novosphingobium sp. AAP83 TaxID=1523425 RepID=UPI0006B946AC|nr:DUF3768 domain-containing protein [Novosphingobium sp. AAP83]KPF92517.1 hypothetical protein IP81_06510 [Novosphingobium sp. AAP83]